MPFFFEPARLVWTVCGITGSGSACDRSSCKVWREKHLQGQGGIRAKPETILPAPLSTRQHFPSRFQFIRQKENLFGTWMRKNLHVSQLSLA